MTAPLIVVAVVALLSTSASAMRVNAGGSTSTDPQIISDSSLQASTTTIGGASPLRTDQTIPYWFGQSANPSDGVTYGYNMVGANPNSCSGSACSVTIKADITPIVVNIDGLTFSGSDVLGATLASPVFATNDYGSTPAATTGAPNLPMGPGGALSQGDAGNQLQLEDATMRAQFNQVGSSPYHLILQPTVLPAVTINVPQSRGVLLQSGRGVVFADVDYKWWSSAIGSIINKQEPTHLPILLTNNVLLHIGPDINNCCVIGFHGAYSRSTNGNGISNKIQTFAWASWVQPGLYSRPMGGTDWALQDIHALSHEISEWADDPFVNNTVQPWLTPTAPQYGCSGLLETGDPVVSIGFAMGTNTFQQGPNPNGSQSADGYYHPEDEVFVPWFMRTDPNLVSEPTQTPTTTVGRYTLMGTLNQFAGFGQPATGCS
jgi:hypothetical protein